MFYNADRYAEGRLGLSPFLRQKLVERLRNEESSLRQPAQ